MRRIQVYGYTDSAGNPQISNMDKFNKLFADNKGSRFIMDISVMKPKTVTHHVYYIMGIIIPAYIEGMQQKGTMITPKEAYHEILDICPGFYKTEKERFSVFDWAAYKPDCEMSALELEYAIEFMHIYILQNFGISTGNTKII
jgi:hypothetical protein